MEEEWRQKRKGWRQRRNRSRGGMRVEEEMRNGGGAIVGGEWRQKWNECLRNSMSWRRNGSAGGAGDGGGMSDG